MVLLDVSMPETNTVELLQEIKVKYPKLPILILSMLPEDQYAIRMLKAGASGYVTKASAADQLISAIRKVSTGGRFVSPELAEKLAFDLNNGNTRPPHELLSEREYQVLCLVGTGKQIKEIADDLSLSIKTVSTYRTRILEKMSMSNNAELIHYVIKNQLLP
jgi:DNA-binding NarL/FixJ family response regulator